MYTLAVCLTRLFGVQLYDEIGEALPESDFVPPSAGTVPPVSAQAPSMQQSSTNASTSASTSGSRQGDAAPPSSSSSQSSSASAPASGAMGVPPDAQPSAHPEALHQSEQTFSSSSFSSSESSASAQYASHAAGADAPAQQPPTAEASIPPAPLAKLRSLVEDELFTKATGKSQGHLQYILVLYSYTVQ